MKTEKAGEYAALLCIIVAVLAGLVFGANFAGGITGVMAGYVAVLLVVLGVIIGVTTISEKEVTAFLITTIVFVVGAAVASPFGAINNVISPVGTMLNAIVTNIAVFVLPAALIQGFKAIYALASRK
jgi:hypothetical protein